MQSKYMFVLLLASHVAIADAAERCRASDIEIKSIKAGFKLAGTQKFLHGVAVLKNTCSVPVSVRLKVIGLDKGGNPVAVNDSLWTRDALPPGRDYVRSLDTYLDYDPSIKSISVEPVEVRQ